MRKIYNSISGKFILISLGLILFWIFAGFLVVDRINTSRHINSVHNLINENITRTAEIEANLKTLITAASQGGQPDEGYSYGETEQLRLEIITSLNSLESDPLLAENIEFSRRIRMIRESCNELNRIENEYIALLTQKGNLRSGLILKINTLIDKLMQPGNEFPATMSATTGEDFNEYLINNDPEILESLINELEIYVSAPGELIQEENSTTGIEEQNLPVQLLMHLNQLLRIDQKLGFYNGSSLTNNLLLYNKQLIDHLKAFKNTFALTSEKYMRSSLNRLYILLLLAGFLITAILIRFSSNILSSFDKLIPALKKLSEGEIPEPVHDLSGTETEEIAKYTNNISESLKGKISFAGSIGENNRQTEQTDFNEKDILGNSLVKLNKKLLSAEEKNRQRFEEEQTRNWFNEGIARFGEIFRSDWENIDELSFLIINKLVKYLEASHGSVFILNEEHQDKVYELSAAFAYDRRKYHNKQIAPGEGLAGTSALEKQTIYLTDIPDDYIEITTGLGESPPRSLLIVPLIYEKESFGIIEMASLKTMHEHEIEFVEKLSESIATTLSAAKNNIKTMHLLQQSRLQAEEMARQEEAMRKNMQELERAQEESRRKEFEISGILNAINNSSMVAEYSLNGRFAEINEKFSSLLELTADQILGKHHSEFSTSERHSDEYKQFWSDLRNGQTKFLIEKFRLFNGKEIWLRQTYTPIKNDEGKILKILNIAYDVTETRHQQEALKKQAGEITRKNIEMHSLSEAVDHSIIKCELSAEGMVMDVNRNYCEITGLTEKELLGKNLRLFLKEIEIENFDAILEQVAKGKTYSGVVRRTKPTGEEVWLMSNFSPVKDEKGTIYKIYFLAQDITEKRLKYQLLEEANKEIERLHEKLDKKQE